MDVLLFRALSLLGLAILVALAARRLRLPYTVGLVLAGAALAATRSHAGLALTHDLIFDVVLPPLLFEAALNLRWLTFGRGILADGSVSSFDVYQAKVMWDGRVRRVFVDEFDATPFGGNGPVARP